MGKVLFKTEAQIFAAHLYPHQLSVCVSSGAEVMAHISRSWMHQHNSDLDRILLDTDESNAHNEVDRHTFLTRAREVVPGICRWLEFIYPTECPTLVFTEMWCSSQRLEDNRDVL